MKIRDKKLIKKDTKKEKAFNKGKNFGKTKVFDRVKTLAEAIISRKGSDKLNGGKGQPFSIRNKIFVCFLVPTLFIVIVGLTAYNMASNGMAEKFQESTIQTLKMAMEYIELGNTLVESKALEYAYDKELNQYASGMYKDDLIGAGALTTAIREDMGATKNSNPFVADIYIITKKDITMATTKKSTVSEGNYDEYMVQHPWKENFRRNGLTVMKC